MISPRFKLSQDYHSVTITIRAPYCSLSELDVEADENVFLFVCKPYYLRLALPGYIVNNDSAESKFNSSSGEFSFTYPKKLSGEHFKDLDLVNKLLVPKVEASYNDGSKPIELIFADNNVEDKSKKSVNYLDYGFGFALRGNRDFAPISAEFDEIFEIDPQEVSLQERRKLKLQYEQGKFDVAYYLADLFDNDDICEIISQKCPYENAKTNPEFNFTEQEFAFLSNLPNIFYELCPESLNYCYNGLLDILFAYCYDQRITQFEGNVGSGWTISKLASTLCWLDGFQTPKEVLISAFRRSLIYPLYRHFDLAQTVFEDLKTLISLEEKYIIKVLLKIYNIFLQGDSGRYILNNLFIRDYIIYIMKWDTDLWRLEVMNVLKLYITKDDMGLNLREIEECEIKGEVARMAALLNMTECNSDSDDGSSSSEDSSDDSSSSEDSDDYTESSDDTNLSSK